MEKRISNGRRGMYVAAPGDVVRFELGGDGDDWVEVLFSRDCEGRVRIRASMPAVIEPDVSNQFDVKIR